MGIDPSGYYQAYEGGNSVKVKIKPKTPTKDSSYYINKMKRIQGISNGGGSTLPKTTPTPLIKVTGDGDSDKDVDDWTNSENTDPKVSDFINPDNFKYCDTYGNISDKETEKEYWFGDNPLVGVTISDDNITVIEWVCKD